MIKSIFNTISGFFNSFSLYIIGGLLVSVLALSLYVKHVNKKYEEKVSELAVTETMLLLEKANSKLWQSRYIELQERLKAFKQVEKTVSDRNKEIAKKTATLKEKVKTEARNTDEKVNGYAILLDGFISLRDLQKEHRNK